LNIKTIKMALFTTHIYTGMIKETMNTTTNLFILLIVISFIIPATAIRYAQGQPGCEGDSCEPATAPQENNNTGNTTSTGVPENTTTPSGLPPPATDNSSGSKPPATTANSPTSPQNFQWCPSPNNCPSIAEQTLQSELQHRSDSDSDKCDDRDRGDRDDRGGCR
jgi:hypothetical protein